MGFLREIHIENFKSWRGKKVIGPFMRFSCIIGTNGSGKSNVMDAISFVMGERAPSLRVKHTRDLIHGAHVGKPVSERASVSMIYVDDGGDDVVFSRSISGDSSEYCINNKVVTLVGYRRELQEIGIVTKARNCLVFQGAVESIALKNPKERTKMLEQISQSIDYADDYERKKEVLQKAKEDTQFLFNKKKAATVERKQVSHEKIEAQKYQDLLDSLGLKRVQLCLFQLYHTEKSIGCLGDALAEKKQAAGAKCGALDQLDQAVKAHKRDHGRLCRELQQIEKDIRVQEQALSLRRPQYIKAKVNTSHHGKKVADARAALQKGLALRARKQAELADVMREMEELEAVWRGCERQALEEEASRGRDIHLEAEQLEQYQELRELARKQGAVLNQQLEKLHRERQADAEKMAFDLRKKKEVEAGILNNQRHLEDLVQRAEKLEDYTSTSRASLQQYGQQAEALGAELQRGRQRSEEVNQELGQVLRELGDARLDSHESRRQQQRKDVLESLRRLYPDTVYGRLVDLCSPIHKKYHLAVTKVFGRHMSSIVVSSEKVARDCIRVIKEERSEPETFLPIDYLDVRPLNERLRELQGSKMLVDVVQHPSDAGGSQLKKVVHFVCGNTLVCETIREAQRIAFDGPERLKTVALDGTLFAKSGVISGGSSELRSKAKCWDEKDIRQLKDHKDQLTAELRALIKLKRKETELKQIEAQVQGAQTRLKYATNDLDALRKRAIPACQAEISRMESELANLESQIQMQQENTDMKDAQLNNAKTRLDQMEDLVFADFCALIGVDNIREYEREHLKHQTEMDKKRLEFESQRARLSTQLDYEQEQMEQQSKKLRKLEETIAKEEKSVTEQKKEEEKLLDAVEEIQTKIDELKNLALDKKSQVKGSSAEMEQKAKRCQDANRELAKAQREVMAVESSLEQRRLAKHNLLLACKIQGLQVSLLSGSLDDISEVQLDAESESTLTTSDIYDREALLVIDYSDLDSRLKRLQAEEEVEAQQLSLREEVSAVEELLQRTTPPNLKALEKMHQVKDQFDQVVEAFEASTRLARKSHQAFEEVKAHRFRLFSRCFEHVCVVIDKIYKKLCRNSSAQAILSAENPDEPYLGGINYNCVAPGKRFLAMDNLSGGEKAIAALALIFAVHSFRPAPFFILDEVDAALDNTNIGKVTSFIREESEENMQIIVISLKEEFYSRADALLGVYSELNDCMVSHMLTLDLRPYPLNEDENGGDV